MKCHYCDNEATGEYELEANIKKKRLLPILLPVCHDHENEAMGRPIRALKPQEKPKKGTPAKTMKPKSGVHEHRWITYPNGKRVCNTCGKMEEP